jgi:choline dehydrogenase-like flavoprotein
VELALLISEFYRMDGEPDRRRFCMGGYVCRPGSRGSVTLASGSPLDPPIIDPNYLSDPNDLRLMIELVGKDRELLNAAPFDDIRLGSATPIPTIRKRSPPSTVRMHRPPGIRPAPVVSA